MEIEIYNPVQGEVLPAVKWNYNEVKTWVEDGLANYKGRVYTDNDINNAKKDRAALNKLVDAIDGKRKEMKALYLAPYEEFEAQAKELIKMVKAQSAEIDAQVKAYEDFRKEEKLEEIKKHYAAIVGNLSALIPYEKLHNPKWLNVTTSMSSIATDIAGAVEKIVAGLASIDKLGLAPDITEHVKGVFLKDFDLAAALAEKERIEKQREAMARYEAEMDGRKRAQEPAEAPEPDSGSDCVIPAEKMLTVTFRIRVTELKLKALGEFMRANGIVPKRV